jgi:hypothetical protein
MKGAFIRMSGTFSAFMTLEWTRAMKGQKVPPIRMKAPFIARGWVGRP